MKLRIDYPDVWFALNKPTLNIIPRELYLFLYESNRVPVIHHGDRIVFGYANMSKDSFHMFFVDPNRIPEYANMGTMFVGDHYVEVNSTRTLFIMNDQQREDYIRTGIDISRAKGWTKGDFGGTLLSNTKEFFRQGDFGLLPNGSSLSLILSRLNFATYSMIKRIMMIYADVNGLIEDTNRLRIRSDDLIRRCFGQEIAFHNQREEQFAEKVKRTGGHHDPNIIDIDHISLDETKMISVMVMKDLPDIRSLHLYQLPDDEEDLDELNKLLGRLTNI